MSTPEAYQADVFGTIVRRHYNSGMREESSREKHRQALPITPTDTTLFTSRKVNPIPCIRISDAQEHESGLSNDDLSDTEQLSDHDYLSDNEYMWND